MCRGFLLVANFFVKFWLVYLLRSPLSLVCLEGFNHALEVHVPFAPIALRAHQRARERGGKGGGVGKGVEEKRREGEGEAEVRCGW